MEKFFYQTDKGNMKEKILDFPNQIQEAFKLGTYIEFDSGIKNIVVTGQGGSAINGDILKNYFEQLDINIPVFVVRDYNLPKFIDANSLVIASSYSGNTEETISCYREALRRNCKLVVITSGGNLEESAKANHVQRIIVPKGFIPREALGFMFFPILKIIENMGLIGSKENELNDLVKTLKSHSFEEHGKDFSEKLFNKIPIIYTTSKLYSVAYRWKTQFNENSKIHAFVGLIPEMNHNELTGFRNILGEFHAIILKDDDETNRMKKRIDLTKKYIKKVAGDKVQITEINVKGKSVLAKIFSAIYIGDWISYYLAMKYGVDPTAGDERDELKKEMGAFL